MKAKVVCITSKSDQLISCKSFSFQWLDTDEHGDPAKRLQEHRMDAGWVSEIVPWRRVASIMYLWTLHE